MKKKEIKFLPELAELFYKNDIKMNYIIELRGNLDFHKKNKKVLKEMFLSLCRERIKIMKEIAEYIPYQDDFDNEDKIKLLKKKGFCE